MPSRWDAATRGQRRRVFHYLPPTLMSRNFRLPCTIELQPLSLTPLKMRKVQPGCPQPTRRQRPHRQAPETPDAERKRTHQRIVTVARLLTPPPLPSSPVVSFSALIR